MTEASLTPGAAAHALGVAASTLRSWDRRYGVGPSARSPGGHRRYTPDDMRRLRRMCRLVGEGCAPAEAARRAGDAGPAPEGGAPRRARPGGHTVPTGTATAELQGIARAAIRMDADLVEELLHRLLRERGVVATWEDIAKPLLYGMGVKWAGTGRFVEIEHLLSWSVSSALRRVPGSAGHAGAHGRGVLLACAPQELHTLAMEALAAALSEAGVRWRMLGGATPRGAALAAARRLAPEAVVLWAHASATADAAVVRALVREAAKRREATRVVTAGPGWAALPTAPTRSHIRSLREGVALLAPPADARR